MNSVVKSDEVLVINIGLLLYTHTATTLRIRTYNIQTPRVRLVYNYGLLH